MNAQQAQQAYDEHERKYNECVSKAEEARSFGSYDLAGNKDKEAQNHLAMMQYYAKFLDN